jgi:hypothetical protein
MEIFHGHLVDVEGVLAHTFDKFSFEKHMLSFA